MKSYDDHKTHQDPDYYYPTAKSLEDQIHSLEQAVKRTVEYQDQSNSQVRAMQNDLRNIQLTVNRLEVVMNTAQTEIRGLNAQKSQQGIALQDLKEELDVRVPSLF